MATSKRIWESGAIERDGVSDDLLTAGLGRDGILSPCPPVDAAPRVVSVHKNFRDLSDLSAEGGFVEWYSQDGGDWKVPGTEHIALLKIVGRKYPFTVSVCMPRDFNWDRPLCVVAPSSGSRGLRGSIGDIGAWALANHCALVLTDKGTGSGAFVLDTAEAYDPDLNAVVDPKIPTSFRLKVTGSLSAFQRENPGRVALKHAHSTDNVEADWPDMVLEAVKHGRKIIEAQRPNSKAKTPLKVIAAGVSNGGGCVLRAAEEDKTGLIDGVVAIEPNLAPETMHGARIVFGDTELENVGRPLMDYTTLMAMYLPAAVLSADLSEQPFAALTEAKAPDYRAWSENLCRKGLLDGQTDEERSRSALLHLRALGFGPETDSLQHMMAGIQVWNSLAITYASAYGRFSVEDALADTTFAFASTDPTGQFLTNLHQGTPDERRSLGALGGGLSPGGGVQTLYSGRSIWPRLDDTLFLRSLLVDKTRAAKRVQKGMKETYATAKSRGHPTLILHGRSDSLICPNHTSRAYFGAVAASGTDTRHWRYYEVENAQHFEAFLMLPGLSDKFVPWWPVFYQSLDLMGAHVFERVNLPPSQVVRVEEAFGSDGNGLAVRNKEQLPQIRRTPQQDEIRVTGDTLLIPE